MSRLWDWIGRLWREPVSERRPVDPAGRSAQGSQHLHVEEGAPPFRLEVTNLAGGALSWRSSDTSVAKVEPQDAHGALVTIIGPGTSTLSVSDGLRCETRQVVVGSRPAPQLAPMGLRVK